MMKSLALIFLLAAPMYAMPENKQDRANAACAVLPLLESLLEGLLESQFEPMCVQQVDQIEGVCTDVSGSVGTLSGQLCTSMGDYLLNIVDNNGWLAALRPYLDPFLQNQFVPMCESAISAYLQQQLQAKCDQVNNNSPQQVCKNVFDQLYQQVTSYLNNALCPPSVRAKPHPGPGTCYGCSATSNCSDYNNWYRDWCLVGDHWCQTITTPTTGTAKGCASKACPVRTTPAYPDGYSCSQCSHSMCNAANKNSVIQSYTLLSSFIITIMALYYFSN